MSISEANMMLIQGGTQSGQIQPQFEMNRVPDGSGGFLYEFVDTSAGIKPTTGLTFQLNDDQDTETTIVLVNKSLPFVYNPSTDFSSASTLLKSRAKKGNSDWTNWIFDYKINIPFYSYLEAADANSIELENYQHILFERVNSDSVCYLMCKASQSSAPYKWTVADVDGDFGLLTNTPEGSENLWNFNLNVDILDYQLIINGSEVTQILNGQTNVEEINPDALAYTVNDFKFRIGREYSGDRRAFQGYLYYFENSADIWKIKSESWDDDGSGNDCITSNNGTVLLKKGDCKIERA